MEYLEKLDKMRADPSKLLFFSDMDGTLLKSDKTLSERNMDAIMRLRDAGGQFIIATGRVIQATRHYFDPMGLRIPCILCNGGMIYDCAQNKVVWSKSLDKHLASAHIARLIERFPDVCAEICTPQGIYDININDIEYSHWKLAGFTAEIVDSADDIPAGEEWSKVLFAMEEGRIPEFAQYCRELEDADKCEFITSGRIFHEMLPKNCSKGEAMLRFIEHYGLHDRMTAAMGDYDNDIEMLRNADLAACPSSAQECVKDVCDIVTGSDSENDSVADVIDMILR